MKDKNKKILLSVLMFSLSVFLLVIIIKNVIKWNDSLSWPETQGTVLNLEFKENEQDNYVNYTVHVTYSYSVNGVEYIGHKMNIGIMKWNVSYSQKSWYEKNLSIGNHMPVYYNPDLVTEAVLVRGASGWGELYTIFIAISLFIGAIWIFIVAMRKEGNTTLAEKFFKDKLILSKVKSLHNLDSGANECQIASKI